MSIPLPTPDRVGQETPGDTKRAAHLKLAAVPPSSVHELTISELRNSLDPFARKRNALALALLVADLGLFAFGQWLAITAGNGWARLAGTVLTWGAIVRLFIIGHDACHQALTSSRRLNIVLARIAFVVSLTPYSLWRTGHNTVHHGFNNLRGRDFVWEPKSEAEYRALPAWRRSVEHLYRSALGPAIYYFVEIWWKRLFFPNRQNMPARRLEFTLDSSLALGVACVWVAGIFWYAQAHQQSFVAALLLAFVAPFILWIWTVGIVVYLHHTDPDVRWFGDKAEWQQHKAQVSATAHIMVPWPLGTWMHHIMEHPAHHLNATIPLYNLKAAQRHLYEMGAVFKRTPLTLRHYLECVRTCKLYDYGAKRWIPFPEV